MKIAFLITKAEAGGAQSHVLELIDGLIAAGHEAALAVGDEGWLTARAVERGVTVKIIPDLVHPIHPVRDMKAISQVQRWLQQEQPGLLHAHSSKAGLVGRVASRVTGIPSVFTAHGWAFTGGATTVRKLIAVPSEWLAARTGGEIICVSNYDRELAHRYAIAPEARLHTVWNGIEDVAERAAHGSLGEPVITMVARFAVQKDHATLLRALASISDMPWRLRLVGDGPLLPEAKVLASSLGIEERVDFMGPRSDVAALLAQSDAFVLASRFEGLPISILEAMRAGLPVVASNVGGVPELVDEKTGFLVSPEDATALARALGQLLGNPEIRAEMGAKGRGKFERDFKASTMIEKTLGIYKACLTRKGQRA